MLIMVPKTSEKDGSRLIGGRRKRIRCPFSSILSNYALILLGFCGISAPIGKSSTYSVQTSANIHMNVFLGD